MGKQFKNLLKIIVIIKNIFSNFLSLNLILKQIVDSTIVQSHDFYNNKKVILFPVVATYKVDTSFLALTFNRTSATTHVASVKKTPKACLDCSTAVQTLGTGIPL